MKHLIGGNEQSYYLPERKIVSLGTKLCGKNGGSLAIAYFMQEMDNERSRSFHGDCAGCEFANMRSSKVILQDEPAFKWTLFCSANRCTKAGKDKSGHKLVLTKEERIKENQIIESEVSEYLNTTEARNDWGAW